MLARLSTAFSSNEVQFLGIAIDSAANVRAFTKKNRIPYPVLIAESGGAKAMSDAGDTAVVLPFTVILNRRGNLVYRHLGVLQRAPFLGVLKQLVAP